MREVNLYPQLLLDKNLMVDTDSYYLKQLNESVEKIKFKMQTLIKILKF